MASFTTLPVEIQQQIVDLVFESGSRPEYACVSRQWQALCESKSFASLRLNQARLQGSRDIMTPIRRSYVREIHMDVQLSEYDATKSVERKCRETEQERQRNNQIFTDAIRSLFRVIRSWESPAPGEERGPQHRKNIALSIYASSPSDFPRFGNDAAQIQFRGQLRKRWQSSYLELIIDEDNEFPVLAMISSFACPNTGSEYRRIAPSACCWIANHLPKVQTLDWYLADDERKNLGLRRRVREDFALGLQQLIPQTVRHFKLTYHGGNPSNHDWHPPRLYSDNDHAGDPLSIALRHLAQRLVSLELDAPVALTSEVFWPTSLLSAASVDTPELHFENLERLSVCMAPVAASGSWLFQPHPALGGRPDSPDPEYGNPMVFDREEKPPGEEFDNLYRCLVDPEVAEQYMLAAAKAAAQMPRLVDLRLTLSSPLPVCIDYEVAGRYSTNHSNLWIKGCFPPEPSREVKKAWHDAAAGHLADNRSENTLAIKLVTTFENLDTCLGHNSQSGFFEQEPEIVDIS